MWPNTIIHLNISSWVGLSIGAVHTYGKLYFKDDRVEIKKKLTQIEADILNIKEDTKTFGGYQEGDMCSRFDNEKEVIDLAIKLIEKEYPQVDLLLSGNRSSVSVNEAFWGKDKKLVDKINELYKEADSLDFYSGKDDVRMQELDDNFQELLGLELL